MHCFNRFWDRWVVKIWASQWNSIIFETGDIRFSEICKKMQRRFGHKWVSNSCCRTTDNNSAGDFSLSACESVSMCVVVRSQVVCVTFYVFFMICTSLAPHLRLTCASLDNDIIHAPKHTTTHLNAQLICTNTHTCTSGSLVDLKVSIRSKKTEKSEWYMLSFFNSHDTFFVCVQTRQYLNTPKLIEKYEYTTPQYNHS